ncbi:alpha/beta hydrolase [Williamsia sterculiae]|uniref:alpha/beta hydrolase n=1 Tax=Williamsia sterculiae TaxID=1344003 RepID=UPI001EEC0BF7|nr:alpha/beta hydrolase-fold protein [Williamsia sterculiae]
MFGRRLVALLVTVAAATGLAVGIGGGTASAAGGVTSYVGTPGMPAVKVRTWTTPNAYRTVVLLDGLRATSDVSGWEHNLPGLPNYLNSKGINVVEPIGGLGSFFSDWDAVNNFSGYPGYRYRWGTFLNSSLINWMDARGLRKSGYAIAGISMGGNAAMVTGANNSAYTHLFSMSGYLNLSAPGMREAIRISLLDAGIEAGVGPLNSDSMWGPPTSPRWLENDPFVQINKMHNKKVRVAAGTGLWGKYNGVNSVDSLLNNIKGSPLETLALAQSRSFQVQAAVNRVNITSDFPITGTHTWGYWNDMVVRAANTGWFR